MPTLRFQASFVVLGGTLLCAPLSAESLRCGDRLASTGQSTYEVQGICGAPDEALTRVEYRTERVRVPAPCVTVGNVTRCEAIIERTVTIVIDDWTYDFGKNRFVEFLRFEDGKLVAINEGGYGHKPAQ